MPTALTGPTAKTPLDEAVKTTSSDQTGAGGPHGARRRGRRDSPRQAIGTLVKKPIA